MKTNSIDKIIGLYEKILFLEERQQEAEDIFSSLLNKYRETDYDRRTYDALKEIIGTQKNINYTQRKIIDVLVKYSLTDIINGRVH